MKWNALYIFLLWIFLLLGSCTKHHVILQGYIEGDLTNISSAFGGDLKVLNVTRGDRVKANQLLFKLDPEPEQSILFAAQAKHAEVELNLQNLIEGQRSTIIAGITAQLEQAKAELTFAKQTLDRYKNLVVKNAIDKASYDRAVSDYNAKQQKVSEISANLNEAKQGARKYLIEAQKQTVQSARLDVQKYRWQLEQKIKYVAKAGFVFDTFFTVGEYVPAGQSVVSLLTPDNIYIVFYIPERFLSSIHLKQLLHFNCDGCKKEMGRIYYISPKAEYTPPVIYSRESRDKLVYRIEADILNNKAVLFHPGQPVEVELEF